MKPKTAIITLIIIVIACGLFMVYLFDVMKLEKNYKNTILKQTENGDEYIKENNQIQDKDQRRLETIKAMEEAEKINPSVIPEENTQAIEQRRLETIKAMEEAEKTNPSMAK